MGADKLDTIRKLLAKAERAATAAEAEVYTAKAVELAARHGVDAALLAARSGADGSGADGSGADGSGADGSGADGSGGDGSGGDGSGGDGSGADGSGGDGSGGDGSGGDGSGGDGSGGDGSGGDGIGGTRIAVGDPYSAGKARLLGWVAIASGCRSVLHGARAGRVDAVTVFGYAADRERVELLYTSLLLQAVGRLVRVRPPGAGESVAAYRRSWLHGFAVEVHRRLTAAHAAAAEEAGTAEAAAAEPGAAEPGAPSVALVLADRRHRVDRAYVEAFPRLGAPRRAALSGSGFGDGTRAGTRADLGSGAVTAPRGPRALPA